MSDVTVAPAATPAPTNEVPVTPSQTSTPNPLGSQAPQRQGVDPDFKGSEHRPESRREAIQRAFQRHEQARGEMKPAVAKPGHNNPPEATENEKPAPKKDAPINLRKRPTEPVKEQQQEREPQPRAEHGHWAAREQQQEAARRVAPNQQQQRPPTPQQLQQWSQPLGRMSQAAKADWMKVPETVRADVHRLHTEFGRAYQQYRGDHEQMNTIRPFAAMAQQHGTTLQRALTNYVSMEQKLRDDVVGGLDVIINNLNLRTPDGKKLGLADVAWHIVNQTPEQRKLLQSQNTMMAQSHQLQAASQRIAALENQHRQMQYAAAFHQTRGGVDEFAKTHPRLDELGDLIEQEVKFGFDLETAYRRAEMLRPAGTAPQTRNGTAAQTRNTTAQTRTPDRSISGAPGGTSNGTGTHTKKPVGRREAIANAMKRVGSSL